MATNTYTYGSLGERWVVETPTSKANLDISRVKADANRWTLTQLLDDADDSPFALADGTTATTQGSSDNTTKLATTAYVTTAVAASSTSPGGSNTQIQYNNSGAFGASANLTFDGSTLTVTGAMTMANAAGPTIVNEAATATNPTLIPNKAEVDTGYGWAAADTLTAITGGTERMRIDNAGNIMAGGTTSTYNASFGAANDVFVDIGGAGGGAVEFTRGADANATWIGGIHFANTNNSSTSNNANGYGIASILGEVVTTDSNAHDDSGGSIVFYTKTEAAASAERMRILSGGGLTFNGDTAAANALDDYEEGTFTPVLRYASTSYSASGSEGQYIKIGRMVYYSASITITNAAVSNDGSTLDVAGMPYTIENNSPTGHARQICTIQYYTGGTTILNVVTYGVINTSNVNLLIIFNNGGSWQGVPSSHIYQSSNNNNVFITGCYSTG